MFRLIFSIPSLCLFFRTILSLFACCPSPSNLFCAYFCFSFFVLINSLDFPSRESLSLPFLYFSPLGDLYLVISFVPLLSNLILSYFPFFARFSSLSPFSLTLSPYFLSLFPPGLNSYSCLFFLHFQTLLLMFSCARLTLPRAAIFLIVKYSLPLFLFSPRSCPFNLSLFCLTLSPLSILHLHNFFFIFPLLLASRGVLIFLKFFALLHLLVFFATFLSILTLSSCLASSSSALLSLSHVLLSLFCRF